jgi:hypothetical protein
MYITLQFLFNFNELDVMGRIVTAAKTVSTNTPEIRQGQTGIYLTLNLINMDQLKAVLGESWHATQHRVSSITFSGLIPACRAAVIISEAKE